MSRCCLVAVALLVLAAFPTQADEPVPLPGTAPLTWQGDLADRMMDGLHRHVERMIAGSVDRRGRHWKRDTSSADAYEKSVADNRRRFRKVIGVVDPRVGGPVERVADVNDREGAHTWASFHVSHVRWPVLDGVSGEGLLLEPKGDRPTASVIVLPDADQTPEEMLTSGTRWPARLAANGLRVLVPVLIDRSDRYSGNDLVAWTNQTHREWIYRQAYHMGRHIIGYEVQKVLAAVNWLVKMPAEGEKKIGVAGYGEGGLIAFYSAAADTRIRACLVSGYFDSRQRVWQEPLYRNVWGLLDEFGDAEIATFIAPRGLIVEHSEAPQVAGPPKAGPGRRRVAAAGKLTAPELASVQAELRRIDTLVKPGFQPRHLVTGKEGTTTGPGSQEALRLLVRLLGSKSALDQGPGNPGQEGLGRIDPEARQKRQVRELERHSQRLLREAEHTRAEFFSLSLPPGQKGLAQLQARAPHYRDYLLKEVLGKIDEPLLPARPRSRKVYDRPKWVGYEVVLDVYPDVFAWGVLLLPRDLKPGEKRPVVVCQHGRNGVPRDVIEGDSPAYHNFAARLAERGFITFAPHNPYRGEDRYRFLSRKGNTVKASLFSYILAQHTQILSWLGKLPQVDPQRIAFYGLSYGGETAVRVPPLLPGYCLSICSADFNDWARKVVANDNKVSFLFTVEWEMPYFDMGSTFNYAELAALMAPRPFMVERGHDDGVAPDEWVAYEYARVRRLYDRLELGDRTAIDVFNGGHTIHGQGTFDFLHRHLRWPAP